MRLTLRELRWIIEAYDRDLIDDPAWKKRSVLVPDDVKDAIKRWSRQMGLTRKRKRAARL